eukprot:scaffold6394_cov71-Phaeocystis_antarctica.AAC.4
MQAHQRQLWQRAHIRFAPPADELQQPLGATAKVHACRETLSRVSVREEQAEELERLLQDVNVGWTALRRSECSRRCRCVWPLKAHPAAEALSRGCLAFAQRRRLAQPDAQDVETGWLVGHGTCDVTAAPTSRDLAEPTECSHSLELIRGAMTVRKIRSEKQINILWCLDAWCFPAVDDSCIRRGSEASSELARL